MSTLVTQPAAERKERALRSLGRLPPFSPVLNKLLASLADEDISFSEVAAVIEKDTVLAGNVLRLVNSALYGRRGTINSVRHAVSLMGLAKVRNFAMTLSVSRMWTKVDVHLLWSPGQFNLNGFAAATLADALAQEVPVEYPEGAFASGLLHGVGLLLEALALREEFGQLHELYRDSGRTLPDCEQEVFGFHHAQLAEAILAEWSLPEPIRRAVAAYPDSQGQASLSGIVHLADTIAACENYPLQSWLRRPDGVSNEVFAAAGLAHLAGPMLTLLQSEIDAVRPFFS